LSAANIRNRSKRAQLYYFNQIHLDKKTIRKNTMKKIIMSLAITAILFAFAGIERAEAQNLCDA
jgi:trehalose/maltose hydrolase-like predicted phosphorylase